MSVGIYKFTNKLNNKSYIGQSIHVEKRFHEHLRTAKKNPKTIFHKAINKYGIENFVFEILEYCNEEELDAREIYYIEYFNTLTPNGYNIQIGGRDSHMIPEDWIVDLQDLLEDRTNTQSLKDIAEEYGISIRNLYRINQGEIWHDSSRSYPLRPKPQYHIGKWYCIDCGKEISNGSKRCVECMIKSQYTVDRPSKEQLATEIVELGFEAVGRKYGVTGNAIKKWCVAYGLPKLKKELIQWVQNNL